MSREERLKAIYREAAEYVADDPNIDHINTEENLLGQIDYLADIFAELKGGINKIAAMSVIDFVAWRERFKTKSND